jgi:hypothetical protein
MYLTLARVPIERPHHADARHHGGSILFGDQDQAPIWRAADLAGERGGLPGDPLEFGKIDRRAVAEVDI